MNDDEVICAELVAELRSNPVMRNDWRYKARARLWRMVWP